MSDSIILKSVLINSVDPVAAYRHSGLTRIPLQSPRQLQSAGKAVIIGGPAEPEACDNQGSLLIHIAGNGGRPPDPFSLIDGD